MRGPSADAGFGRAALVGQTQIELGAMVQVVRAEEVDRSAVVAEGEGLLNDLARVGELVDHVEALRAEVELHGPRLLAALPHHL